jgi:hypothetical protein
MKLPALAALLLLALPLAAVPAAATCQVVSAEDYPDVNYTTLCLLDEGTQGDPGDSRDHDYLAHASHAVEADPFFDVVYAHVDQSSWTHDDGETQHGRERTDVSAGAFEGVRGVAGTGFQAALDQRDQTAPEDESGGCSGFVGRSTCLGASGWLTVQDVASVGVGAYYQQSGTGADCRESFAVYVDAVVVFVPVTPDPQACTTELPYLYDEAPFRELPSLP